MPAVRAACGIAAVMAAVQALDSPGWSIPAIMGAWLGGVGLLTPGTRTEPGVPLLIGLAGAGGLLLGAIDHAVLLVAAAALYGFALTLLGSISLHTGITLTVSGLAFFLSEHLAAHTDPWTAAAAVGAGGAVQALTALLPPRYRWAEDRRILAGAWRALADEAAALADAPDVPFRTEALAEAARELDRRRALPAAIVDARAQMYAVSAAIGRVASARARADARDQDTVGFHSEALRLCSRLLAHFADEITAPRPTALDWDELVESLGRSPVATSTGTIPAEVGGLLRTLHDTERYAARIATGSDDVVADRALRHATGRARESLQELAGHFHRADPVLHHSLRRAGVVALATAIGLAWPLEHGYWIPLTAWLVLQADFAGTLTRGVTRAVGTLGGVVVASGLSLVIPHVPLSLSLTVLAYALLAYLARPVSMLVFAAAVAGFTVFQVDLSGQDALGAAADRAASTAIGASVSIGFYMLVPTWQTRRLGDLLADLIDAYGDYARLALGRQANPADYDAKLTHAVIDGVRSKRAALATAADQAKAEPVGGPGPLSADALGAEEALSRAARALVAVNASAGSSGEAAPLPGVEAFAQSVDAAYRRLAALAGGEPPPLPVDLAEAARRLDAELAEGDAETRARRSVLRWEIDNLVEALDDVGLLIAGWGRP